MGRGDSGEISRYFIDFRELRDPKFYIYIILFVDSTTFKILIKFDSFVSN